MRRTSAALLTLLLMMPLSGGCGGAVLSGPSSVQGGVWKLQSLESGQGLVGIDRADRYTVEFRDGNLLSARADCNTCAGTYSINGPSLQIGALACTRAFCGSASYDILFLEILTGANHMGVRGTELSIESPKGVARFNR